MKLLVAGGAGFIGSNFVRYLLRVHPDWQLVNVDLLTYAGNLENLAGVLDNPNHRFVKADISEPRSMSELFTAGFDAVVNFAAESHVDRSIEDPTVFLKSNLVGAQVLLDQVRKAGRGRFLQVSTDEVYGSLGSQGRFTEDSPLRPNSPYAASKAAADLLVRAYISTYGLDALVTRCSNNYGPYQFPEKLIPLFITNALAGEPLPLYGDGLNVRDWIHVEDHCRAIDIVLQRGRKGATYNVGADNERTNREITELVLKAVGKPADLIRYVEDRPGHDRRYAIDASRLRKELGWRPKREFTAGIIDTVNWYMTNRRWWERVRSGEYREYYARMYEKRLGEARS